LGLAGAACRRRCARGPGATNEPAGR
jgi:hypothetical protein